MKLYKYTFRSPLNGSICCEELFVDTDGRQHIQSDLMATLAHTDNRLHQFMERMKEDLTPYLSDDLKDCVRKLEVGDIVIEDYNLWLLAHAYVDEELTEAGLELVGEYLISQYSDGWGESLQQHEWREDTVYWDVPYFDGDWSKEEQRATTAFYVEPEVMHPAYLELRSVEIVEVEDPKPSSLEELIDLVHELNQRICNLEKKLNT